MPAVDELFRQVWAHPDDDQLRLVLADALMAIDDPRGELIHLQFHPERDQGRRAMRLLQANGLRWLGALRGAVTPITYERGFIASCAVHDPTGVVGADEWSTVHTVALQDQIDPDFLFDPVMRSLRQIERATANLVERLAGSGGSLATRIDKLEMGEWWSLSLYRAFAMLPALREVRFREPAMRWTTDADGRLSCLDAAYSDELIDVLRWLPSSALTRLAIRDVPVVEREALEVAASGQNKLVDFAITTLPERDVYE